MNKKVSFKSACWLLLVLFYLRYPVAELVKRWGSFSAESLISVQLYRMIVEIFAILLPIVVYFYIYSSDLKYILKINKTSSKNILFSFLAGITITPIALFFSFLIKSLLTFLGVELASQATLLPKNMSEFLSLLLFSTIFPAFTEEPILRGAILSTTKNDGFIWSFFINAILFTIMHIHLASFGGTFMFALLACYLVWMTDSLFCSIAAHLAYNSTIVIIARSLQILDHLQLFLFLTVGAIVSVAVFIYVVKKIYNPDAVRPTTTDFGKKLLKTITCSPVFIMLIGYIILTLKT